VDFGFAVDVIIIDDEVEVGVNKIREYAVDVYVVVAPVALMMERSVTKGRKNSEQNAVALRVIGEGGFKMLLATA